MQHRDGMARQRLARCIHYSLLFVECPLLRCNHAASLQEYLKDSFKFRSFHVQDALMCWDELSKDDS